MRFLGNFLHLCEYWPSAQIKAQVFFFVVLGNKSKGPQPSVIRFTYFSLYTDSCGTDISSEGVVEW